MTLSDIAPAIEVAAEPRASLRERKKLATRRLLRQTALSLIAERGYSNVTVEDIAAAAEVSARTFFNYFPTKEAALFGSDPDRWAEVREHIVHDAPGRPVLEVVRGVLLKGAQNVLDDLAELGGDPADWLLRIRAVRADPHLRAAHASQMATTERAIVEALAERLGTDPDLDPYPGLLCAIATGAFRNSMSVWAGSGGRVTLDRLIDLSFQALADGLPEDCELRRFAGSATGRKDDR